MDAQTCLKKLQYVGVLNFATVGLDGAPQVRCISKSGCGGRSRAKKLY